MRRGDKLLLRFVRRDGDMMTFPDIDPIAFALGPLVIRWYALAYVTGILLGYLYIGWLDRKQRFFSDKAREDLILYAVLGVILGGRIGYILFYNLPFFLGRPQEMLAVWHGGMSFHGGLLGVLIAFYLFARRFGLSYLRVLDFLAAATPIGLFFGRLANFVNGELFGRVTDSKWGMVFPDGGPLPRYPSQLFEAAAEGLLLFLVLFFLATRTPALRYRGVLGGTFIAGYGLARLCIEFFRQPDPQLGLVLGPLSMGQLLCLPMILFGLYLLLGAKSKPNL
jgi:phosphatidylglycerol:prolipoprotein diacylglycerol transferase